MEGDGEPPALERAGAGRSDQGAARVPGGERGVVAGAGTRVSRLTPAPALLPARALVGTCRLGTVPRFPSSGR